MRLWRRRRPTPAGLMDNKDAPPTSTVGPCGSRTRFALNKVCLDGFPPFLFSFSLLTVVMMVVGESQFMQVLS